MSKPMRQQLVAEQAGRIADLLDVNIEDISFDSNGIKLAHDQMQLLIRALITQGWKNAATTLREAADKAREEGQHSTRIGALAAGASFLRDQIEAAADLTRWAKQQEECKCRCKQGSHCGGCGHDGCGYRAEVGS